MNNHLNEPDNNIHAEEPKSLTLREKLQVAGITIEHFKKIKNATLSLEKGVTYVVGTNRSGKSSFLQAAMMMASAAQ